jgi:hypothetical protein
MEANPRKLRWIEKLIPLMERLPVSKLILRRILLMENPLVPLRFKI